MSLFYSAGLGGGAIPDGAVAHWKFDDDSDSSTAIDSEGPYDLSLYGPTYSTSAKVGNNALLFDGGDDTATAGTDLLNESNAWSVCGWVNLNGSGKRQTIITNRQNGSDNEFQTVVDSDDVFKTFQIGNGNLYASSYAVGTGSYVFLGFAFDGSGSAIMKKGSSSETVSGGDFGNLSRNWEAGYTPEKNGEHLDGTLDDWFVYGRQLSDSEMEELRQRGL